MPFQQSTKGRSRNKKCPCKSGKKYKKCCMSLDIVLKRKFYHLNARPKAGLMPPVFNEHSGELVKTLVKRPVKTLVETPVRIRTKPTKGGPLGNYER